MNETRILITLLRMYVPRNWEFGLALSKLRNFFVFFWGGEGGFEHPPTPLGTPLLKAAAPRYHLTAEQDPVDFLGRGVPSRPRRYLHLPFGRQEKSRSLSQRRAVM
jgi:hypothetical protein